MPVTFVRSLGYQPGVQLNPLIDNSDLSGLTVADQTFGVVMRTKRGRIDRAFTVERGTLQDKIGGGETIRVNSLNEAWAQLYEALAVSGGSAVVSRLVREDQATIKWAACTMSDGTLPTDPKVYGFSVEDEPLDTGFLVQVKHLACHNDGIKLSVWAEPTSVNRSYVPTKIIGLQVLDSDGRSLFAVKGSTDPYARDEFGRGYYLPDVIASRTDDFEVLIEPNLEVAPGDPIYGYDDSGFEGKLTSDILLTFDEGDQAYMSEDYEAAVERLKYSQDDFRYIASGGTHSTSLLAKLAVLSFDSNRQLRYDVDGSMDVESAIAFVETLNMASWQSSHLLQAFWMPVISADASGVNPIGYLGSSMLNIAMACKRNARRNAKGLSMKNYPVAGRLHPVPRSGLRQMLKITEPQLSEIARAHFNPVVFDTFTEGSMCVYRDQITQAPVTNSLRLLISVVDMCTDIDDRVVKFGKDLINSYPMTMAIKRMRDFLTDLFDAAEVAGWLIPSEYLDGKSYLFNVAANEERPYDKMDVTYSLRYDGAVRQIVVTQTLSR